MNWPESHLLFTSFPPASAKGHKLVWSGTGSAEMSDESRSDLYNISRRDCSAFDEANATQMDLESCHLPDFS